MNFEMADATVQQHTNEIRSQVARSRGHSADRPATTPRRPLRSHRGPGAQTQARRRHPSGLRNRLGITLIEAGLHLVAADAVSQSRG